MNAQLALEDTYCLSGLDWYLSCSLVVMFLHPLLLLTQVGLSEDVELRFGLYDGDQMVFLVFMDTM